MRVVKPITVVDSILTSSTIPEDDYPEWSAGSYIEGDRVIKTSTHRMYEAQTTTTDDPEVGVDLVTPTWLDIGATRPWRMFDGLISTQSSNTLDIVVNLLPGRVIGSLAVFNMSGVETVNVTMTDPLEGVVYTRDVSLFDDSAVIDWYSYFFEPIITKKEFVLLDLPSYSEATITITFTVVTEAYIGEMVIGSVLPIGITNHGTSLQLMDFSRKERDDFGNFTIVKRRTSKLVGFNVTIETTKVGYVFDQLSQLTTTLAVYVGTGEEDDPTLVYGYYKELRINIDEPSISDCSLDVESVI